MLARFIVGLVFSVIGFSLQRGAMPLGAAPAAPHRALSAAQPDTGIAEFPVVDIPPAYRVHNWTGPTGSGSCVHASMVMLFNWQGRPDLGAYWQQQMHSGEKPEGLARKMDSIGVAWAGVTNGDVGFLEWAVRTRRGCGVTVQGGSHMVCLVHLDEVRAGILDNNSPGKIRWTSRDAFLREWLSSGYRWAVTPVYDPPPRLPFVEANPLTCHDQD